MELTMNRLLYLLYLNRAEECDCTISKMARLFQVSKSTVSRNLDYFVEQGIVYSDSVKLTGYGQHMAEHYSEEVELMENWVEWTASCGDKKDRENAMHMVVCLDEEMKTKMFQKIRMRRMFEHLNYRGNISFSEFAKDLEDGNYPVGFVIYREDFQDGKYFSMADKGFSHPANMKVMGENGIIQLKAVTMERRNILDNLILSGKLMKLEYSKKGNFVPVLKSGDIYQIPADAFEYNFHKDENLLIGNMTIRLYAPLANKKMHVKRAVLSLIIHAA